MESGIYKITNPNGRIYIGQSMNIANRFKTYHSGNSKSRQQVKLYRSFLKYGIGAHSFEIIENCDIDSLNIRERHWQDYYDVLNGGLNCCLTYTNHKRGVMSDETKNKLSLIKTGFRHTEEAKRKIGMASIGKQYSVGRVRPQEERDRISATLRKNKTNVGSRNGAFGKISLQAKSVIKTDTGEIYPSLKLACIANDIKYTKGRKHLSGQNKNTTGLVYLH